MLYNNWLRKPVETTKMLPDQTIETTTKMNLWHIKSRALLKETQTWNSKNNYDRHDAMVFLMLLREDFLRYCGTESPSERNHYKDNNYLGNDTFFEKKKNTVLINENMSSATEQVYMLFRILYKNKFKKYNKQNI